MSEWTFFYRMFILDAWGSIYVLIEQNRMIKWGHIVRSSKITKCDLDQHYSSHYLIKDN